MNTPLPLLPALSCDTHMHIFGPRDRYPLNPQRGYEPPLALLPDYRAAAMACGLQRAVVVQPSPYGTDNRCTLDAVAAMGPAARAVLVVDPAISDAELRAFHAAGARGLRFNLVQVSQRPSIEALESLARRIAPLGWHLQFYVGGAQLVELAERFARLPVPVVIDHMGHMNPALGLEQPAFTALRRLIDAGQTWVKLSGAYRVDVDGPPYSAAAGIARTLLQQAPERMVWATDWPHVDLPSNSSGEVGALPAWSDLITALIAWCGNDQLLEKVLVDNPKHLYGF